MGKKAKTNQCTYCLFRQLMLNNKNKDIFLYVVIAENIYLEWI